MSGSTGKQHDGTAHEDLKDQSLKICIEIGLSAMDKLYVPIDNTTTVRDLKCEIEFLSGIPSDLFELDHNGSVLTESLVPMMSKFEGLRAVGKVKLKILPVWERFISTCLKAENSQVRARIRVKMHGVTKEERIFVACFVAARKANSCLLFGILPSNKMITRTVRLSGRNILHAAVIGGKTNCIANILMHGGGKLMNMEDIHNQTPLSMARTLSKGDIVDMLEAYKMVSLRGERSLKGTNDDDSGYGCIITSQSLEETKESYEQDSEEDYKLSSDGEEEDETQNVRGESDEMSSSFSTDRHFLDEFAGHDESAATSNDVTTRFDGSSEEKLLIEQIKNSEKNGSKEYEKKTTCNKDSWISGDNKQANEKITYLSEQGDEDNYLVPRQASPRVCCQERADYSKTAKTMNVRKRESEKEYEEGILFGNVFKNNDNGMFPKKEQEKGQHFLPSNGYASLKNNDNRMFSIKGQEKISEISTKIDRKINENRDEDVGMVTDKCKNNDSIEWVSNDLENPTQRRSHTRNGKMIFKSDEPQATAVLNENKQPGDTVNKGNRLIEDQPESAKSGGSLLLRRRKKGMPSLVVSRTSSGLSSSFETFNLLDSMGKNIDNDHIAVNHSEETCVNSTDDKQVCAPIIKGPWIPKPPSNLIPIAKTMQQMRRRKFSIGSPTSGSPKFNSRSDMEGYLDEAWRRASDSDVNESLPVPLTRPRSYSTPHPPDPFDISKPMTSSELKSFKSLNAPATNIPNRRQSVGGWGRRNSISLTYDEWLETKKEQHRKNSLAVQKENQRRLSLGNQSTLRLSRYINYEQWLAMKTVVPERKASQDLTNNCHGNERSREESERAFKTWLQKKDEEALERELRLLDEAISRRTSDTKKEDIL
ncbi:uncharacterized protein LOC116300055 [Actinia tenebrosa]|uniref:Uncharacterized protein LOC116300055 n=1 Tax=Actinia tenebrosa TaxID=6105 RepID=A0A6P8I9H3_ACTTE|nr:uncharacterized protein LOC116300055 [Actinia tenebrosa]